MRVPVIDESGYVVNVVLADEAWQPPVGSRGTEGGEIGDYWDGSQYIKPQPEVPPLTAADFANAIQAHVDGTAESKGYANGVALAGYSTSTVPAWATEAQTFIAWRDQVWIHAYTELAKVQNGQRSVPTIDEMIAKLPTITWPGAG